MMQVQLHHTDALRPRNHFRAPSESDPSGPPTPDHATPFYQQRKPRVQPADVQSWADAYHADAQSVRGEGPDEQQIENLRTMLAHIAPDGMSPLRPDPDLDLVTESLTPLRLPLPGHEATNNPYPPYSAGLAAPGAIRSSGSEASNTASTPSLETRDARAAASHGEHEEIIETLAERTAGKRREQPPAPPGGSSSSVMGDSSDAKLMSNLSASDVQFLVSNQEPLPPTEAELRDRIVKQHRFLGQRVEPGAKARKPHENPPAVDKAVRARFKPIGPQEEQARLAALKVQVDNVMEQSVVRGVVVLEKREAVWKPLASDPPPERAGLVETVERAPPLPSAWLLPLDTSAHIAQGKAKSKKTFRLPEFEAMAGCAACDAKGQTMCPLCRNAEPDECFWCEGTGMRKRKTCDNCHGRKIHACLKCDAQGTIACKDCGGNGQVYVGAFVDVKFRTITLPPIAVKDLVHPGTGLPPTTAEEVAQCSKLKMAQTIYELSRIQATKPSPSVPVLARCVWHKSVKRIVSVWRPAVVDVPGQKKLGLRKTLHHHDSAMTDGDTHRFLVPSDKAAPIVEVTAAAAAAAIAHARSGSGSATPSTPGGSGSGSGSRGAWPTGFYGEVTPSAPAPASASASTVHTPSTSVANLQSLWRQNTPRVAGAATTVPAVMDAYPAPAQPQGPAQAAQA